MSKETPDFLYSGFAWSGLGRSDPGEANLSTVLGLSDARPIPNATNDPAASSAAPKGSN
jgi:hypothetical protein